MRIVQLTDLHIGREGEDTYGVDVRGNFLKALQAASDQKPDLLVISGDLCYRDGDVEIYRWIRPKLDQTGIPYEVMSGNHDDPSLLAQAFGVAARLKDGALYFRQDYGGLSAFFLDTTYYELPASQQAWLKEELSALRREALIFMHHPPLPGGVPFMDSKHSLRNMEEVQRILFAHPYPVHVFTGHYHAEKTVSMRNTSVHITPSCFFQISQASEVFGVDHYRPGLRVIDYNEEGLMHTVRYF
ncbi:metallophosphoesterase [Phaeodactylibacter luteus]|uniref:Metallophosphoesterase n=1 Tax=Phaeodactylibacter luteus TaxID=1564516 RepID=A0A5C6RKN3_9BACT|nr:metallophosphoesterase [Phaeodactylibacter luteus]TXB62938.1 metallophosphoesterase [Phaeodactylibacter luteus]